VIYRHCLAVRLTHWVNVLCIAVLVMSGLQIFNAHPHLYWGQKGANFDQPFLSINAVNTPDGPRGVTRVGALRFDTTGLLGWSKLSSEFVARLAVVADDPDLAGPGDRPALASPVCLAARRQRPGLSRIGSR